jgi:site-specific recombinase XerD
MLTPHRRHLKACEHGNKGWNYTPCNCPIWCDGIVGAKRVTVSLRTTNWDRALRRIKALERGEEIGFEIVDAATRTLGDCIDGFLKDMESRNARESTLRSYRGTFAHLKTAMSAERPVAHVDVEAVGAYRNSRNIKPRTARKELEHLRAFFAWCQDRKWISDNPARRLRMPLAEDVATLPFSPEEVGKLIAACDHISGSNPSTTPYIRRRARALVYTLLYSGLRIGDVGLLRRSALDEDTRHLTVRTTKTGVPLKVRLHPDAAKALLTLPARNPVYFFWTGRGDSKRCAKNMWRTIRRLGNLAGVKNARPHRFRDTFAVELLTQGADIRTVQQLLGHESVRTTEKHYAHFIAVHQALLDSATAKLNFEPKPARPVLVNSRKNACRNPK